MRVFFFFCPPLLKADFYPIRGEGCSYVASFLVAILTALFNTISSLLLIKKKKQLIKGFRRSKLCVKMRPK